MLKHPLITCCLAAALTMPVSTLAQAADFSLRFGPTHTKVYKEKKVIEKKRNGKQVIVKKRNGRKVIVKKRRSGKDLIVKVKHKAPKCDKVVIKGPFGNKIKKRHC